MTVDPYSVCPGGTGKKIKFCCQDLVADLDKIQRMIEGDQRVACLDYVAKLETKYPQRACLMAARSMLELSLDKEDDAAATIDAFLKQHPENRVALSQAAVHKARAGKPEEAIRPLLQALEISGNEINANVYQAMSAVAVGLAAQGLTIPARALLARQMAMTRGEDERTTHMLMQLQTDPNIALLVKDEPQLEPAPAGAPWKFEFDVAYQRAIGGQWGVAAEKFTTLVPLAAQSPALWRNLALLRGWLADYPGMVEALRKYTALDVPFDDAVEAEALAQLTDEVSEDDNVEVVEVAYRVANQTDIEERFTADRQIEKVPFDPAAWGRDEEGNDPGPPPRAVCILLDRPIPATAAGLTHDQAAFITGTIQLYGRQTDRPERLVVQTERAKMPQVEALLKRIAGDSLSERTDEPEIIADRIRPIVHVLQWDWRLPKDTTPQQRIELWTAERRDRILNRLPKAQINQIGGQSLEQAAGTPAGRIRAAALILLMDLAITKQRDAEVYNDLRRKLGLPVPGPIDASKLPDVLNTPVGRLHRLQPETLADDFLVKLFQRSNVVNAVRAIANFSTEIIRRPQLSEKIRFAEIHGLLASLADNLDEAVGHLDQARAAAQKARQSSARWDLEELEIRARFVDIQGLARVFEHIRKEHIREEGIAEGLVQILSSLGLIDSAGRVLIPPVAEPSPIIVPGAAVPGKILTADSQPAGAERKSSLWVPGME